ncbi:TIGR03943 family putative permease subunit [Streptomyces sp. NRRL S-481]|uniref:TIGR03943 family putative permease subunit n=1 Tax=Streptomyces sp. NRRL S-481 TaxID=1463911 RepID=UPI0004C75E3A|nr:TIGR03943 family protein [Streptomyces sp. NRRL S-481]
MKRPVQAVLLLLSGLGLLQASLFTDMFLRYVKPGMRPLLIVSGVVLLTLGLAEAWSAYRTARREEGHPPPHVAWLLFLPALSLLFYSPPALGSYTAAREAPRVTETRDAGDQDFDPLPATSPVPITLGDFTRRVRQDRTGAIKERTVRMTGFVTPADEDDGWYLTRLLLNCCAADAQSLKVRVHGVEAPKADTWVTVTGTWHPGGTLGTDSAEVALDVREVKKVQRPSNSYMDALPLD